MGVPNWTTKQQKIISFSNVCLTMAPYKEIGRRIAKIRTDLGLFQSDLATLIGVKKNRITSVEVGRSRASGTILRAISCAMNVPIQEILPDPKEIYDISLATKADYCLRDEPLLTLCDREGENSFRLAVGKNIHAIRHQQQLRQQDVAERIQPGVVSHGTLINYLGRIERGIGQTDIFFLMLLAYVLEASLEDILPQFKIDRLQGFLRTLKPRDAIAIAYFIEHGKGTDLMTAIQSRMPFWTVSYQGEGGSGGDRARFFSDF